jgi:ribosomal protein S27AE
VLAGAYTGNGTTIREISPMADDEKDVRIIALTCPNCGATLQVSPDKDRAKCDHCGSSVLILDAKKGTTKLDTSGSERPIDEKTKKRLFWIVIIVIVVAFVIPLLIDFITSIIIMFVSVLGVILKLVLGSVLLH